MLARVKHDAPRWNEAWEETISWLLSDVDVDIRDIATGHVYDLQLNGIFHRHHDKRKHIVASSVEVLLLNIHTSGQYRIRGYLVSSRPWERDRDDSHHMTSSPSHRYV
jgi:hypothetical protein